MAIWDYAKNALDFNEGIYYACSKIVDRVEFNEFPS